jgi:hypothetical protein
VKFKGEEIVFLNKKIAKKVFLPPAGGIKIKELRAREVVVRGFNELGLFFPKKTPGYARNMNVEAQLVHVIRKFSPAFNFSMSSDLLKKEIGETNHDPFIYFGRAMEIIENQILKLQSGRDPIIKISAGLQPLEIANKKEVLGYINKGYAKNLNNTIFDLGGTGFFSILSVFSRAHSSGWYPALLCGAGFFAGFVFRDIVHHFIDRSYYKTIEFGKSGPEKTA